MKTRKELYVEIKKLQLENEVKELFGRNFTQVSSAALNDVITNKTAKKPEKGTKNITKVDKLVEVLGKKRILLKSELDYILN